MEERTVTLDGVSHPLSEVFTVVPTQNPIEYEGTYRLPEAQLDRFLLKLHVSYPPPEEEDRILGLYQSRGGLGHPLEKLDLTTPSDGNPEGISRAQVLHARRAMAGVTVKP